MIERENQFSEDEEEEVRSGEIEFDPEATFVDEEGDALAFHDAMRDIWNDEGPFEILLP